MELSDKLSDIDYLDKDTKDLYINAGFITLEDVLNSNFDILSQVGKRHKYKYFRDLLRYMHDNNFVFNFEKDIKFKEKIIKENIDIRKLDLSNYMINVLIKYKIYDSKTLYNLLKLEPYKIYKICRSSILNELKYNKCWYLEKFFDFDIKSLSVLENRYIEEKKFYDKFLLEFNYIVLYLHNKYINIDKLQLREETKCELENNNIYSLIDLLIDFRFVVSEDKRFNYRLCNKYDYKVIEDIVICINNLFDVLFNEDTYINFKIIVDNKSINDFNIDKELVIRLGLNINDSIIKLMDRYISYDMDNYKDFISEISNKNNLVKKKV